MHTDIWDYWPSRIRVDPAGFSVEALDGPLGTVESAAFATGASYLVVRTDGGRREIVPAGLVERFDVDDETVQLDRTRDEVLSAPKSAPGRGLDPIYRAQLGTHYGLRATHRERLAARSLGR